MTIGLIGKKIGMTREFFDSGISVPVTVLAVEKGRILDIITKDKRGYDAIQVGFGMFLARIEDFFRNGREIYFKMVVRV